MLMIGVMPLPALMNRSLPGRRSGRMKSPSTPPSETIAPGTPATHEIRRHLALVDVLDGDADQPVLAPRVGGQRVRAPVPHALDVESDPEVLTRPVARPPVARLDQHGGGVGGLVVDLLDSAAQLARRPQRVDQLEVVVGQQRRRERPEHAQDTLLDRMDRGRCTFFGHLLISNIQLGSFSNTVSAHPAKAARKTGTRGMPRAVREQLILDVAGQVFARRWLLQRFDGRDRSPARAISKPMLYAYFESKEGLYAAYIERTGGELLTRLQSSASGDDPPIVRLRARTREFLAFVEEHRDGWTVLFRELAASRPLAEQVAALRREITGAVQRMIVRQRRRFARRGHRGAGPHDRRRGRVARQLVAGPPGGPPRSGGGVVRRGGAGRGREPRCVATRWTARRSERPTGCEEGPTA